MEGKNHILCKKCGATNLPVATYCQMCGEPLEPEEPPKGKMEICPTCKMPYESGRWLIGKIDHINENLQKLLQKTSTTNPVAKEQTIPPHREVESEPSFQPLKIEDMGKLCVQQYNEALPSDKGKREKFLTKYEPVKVSITFSEEIKKGKWMDEDFVPELVRNSQGDLLLVSIDNKPFLCPDFDLDESHFYNIKTCFNLEARETVSTEKAIIQELKKPGECEKLREDAWKLKNKGMVAIKTWPSPLVSKARKKK